MLMEEIEDIEIYVRFNETDAAGHVNNISYFLYMEEARTKFFDGVLKEVQQMAGKMNFLVASTKCDYLQQLYAKQIILVTTSVSRIGKKSFTLEHNIKLKETGEVVAAGSAAIVCFNFKEQNSVPIPPDMRIILERHSVPVAGN